MPTIPPPVRALLAAAILAVAAIFFWMLPARTPDRDSAPAPARPAPEGVAGDAGIRSAATSAPLPPITVLPIATELSQTLLRRDAPVESLQAVEQLIYLYRQALGENPVGQNEDIVATLLGENPKRAAWLPADSPAIKEGKLVDVWGTPYWFHPVSRDRMEVRSAGPDRELFTGDDLLGN